ncbi:MAG: ParB/RepB/Spo0J family partition protein [Bacteroidales bacterium]|nr:ParB/RepB/Spo0J family partition protein [Candidatus Cryptobacteroides caccocaballi]
MAQKQQHGLGKGLSALLGGEKTIDINEIRKPVGYINKDVVTVNTAPAASQADIMRIPVTMVEPNPYQPRMSFDTEALEELSESIRTLGLIQPITVRKSGAKYQIISGERRFRASRLAGMDMIPAYILSTDDQGMLEMAIVENIQRQDLDPIEVALSYQRLIDECQLTQEQMAARVGKKRVSVTNTLRLLRLPAKVQHDIKVGLLSVGHAKVLLSVDSPALQEELCDMVVREGISVRELEDRVRKINEPSEKKEPAKTQLPEHYNRLMGIVGKYGSNVSMKSNGAGKGTMTIRFDSDEQIDQFLSALEKANL